MTQATALKLLAQDAEDLKVVAAALQDAVGRIGDISYEPGARRLTLALNRYRWEARVSIAGGIGSVGAAVLGALFLGVVKNALPVINISPFWQLAISGAAIIIAVAVNSRAYRTKGRIILKQAEVSA